MKTAMPFAILAAALLAACSPQPETGPQAASERDKALLNATQAPLNQAGQVEQQVQDAATAREKQIEEQSQ